MGYSKDSITDLYKSNGYIQKYPSMHAEESLWKIGKLTPFIDRFLEACPERHVNLLDVGGGAGLIARELSAYIEKKGRTVSKHFLDLCPGMLEEQKKNNPDYVSALSDDVRHTGLKDAGITLTLMVDVIEHVPEPGQAIKELNRISEYVLYKVPMENCLAYNCMNFVTNGKFRDSRINDVGHINAYDFGSLKRELILNGCDIVAYDYVNIFQFLSSPAASAEYSRKNLVANKVFNQLYRVSPALSARLMADHVIVLTRPFCKKHEDG